MRRLAKLLVPVAVATLLIPATVQSTLHKLHKAAAGGNIEALQEALQAGMDPNSTAGGWTSSRDAPLHYTIAWRPQPEAAKVLLAAGANPNVQNKNGRTPLHYAVSDAHGSPAYTAIVKMLLVADADPMRGMSTVRHHCITQGRARTSTQ